MSRAAWYTSIGRPNLNQYAGGLTLPDLESLPSSSNRITVNNAGIKAWSAVTGKLSLEYYFGRVGLFSVGAFRRDFENFFGNTRFDATPEFLALYGLDPVLYDPYQVSTQYNLDTTVRMEGVDVNYKQALTFLPRWARGVQVFANAYVGAEAVLHPKCMVNTNAVVSHDCEIGAYTHIAPGALLAGHVHVGEKSLVGMGVTTAIGIKIGSGVRVGNGAILLADVPDKTITRKDLDSPRLVLCAADQPCVGECLGRRVAR